MGKKKAKTANKDDPEFVKEQGNKAFQAQKYDEAVYYYTNAIDLSKDSPNHVYYANRANVYIELLKYSNCIEDCDIAINIEPKFVKSYIRKAKAQHLSGMFTGAMETAKQGFLIEPESQDLKELERQLAIEIEVDKALPNDHPERKKFNDI